MHAGLKGKDMSKVHKREIPETMGAVCAVVYILVVICFIPFPFYKDIVEATSGGGNRDSVKEIHIVETGRFLHRFPHSKVRQLSSVMLLLLSLDYVGYQKILEFVRSPCLVASRISAQRVIPTCCIKL